MARSYQEMLALRDSQLNAAQNQGLIGNILSGFTRPIRRSFEAARMASSAPGSYTPMFESSTAQDIQSAEENPNLNILKSIASIGSIAVPGGGTGATPLARIGTAAGRGAVGGTLSGFGASETGEELGSAFRGGLTGLVAGGALQGIGEGVGALASKRATNAGSIRKAPATVRSSVFKGVDTNNVKVAGNSLNPKAINQSEDIIHHYMKNVAGKRAYTSSDVLNNSGDIIGTLTDALDENAANIAVKGGGEAFNDLASKYSGVVADMASNPQNIGAQELLDILNQVPEEPSLQNILATRRAVTNAANGFDRLGGQAMEARFLDKFYNDLTGLIRESSKEVAEQSAQNSGVFAVLDTLSKTKPKSITFNTGALRFPANLRTPAEKVATTLTRGGTQAGGGLIGGLSKISSSPIAQQVGGRIPALSGAYTPQVLQDLENGNVSVGAGEGQISEETMLLAMGGQQQQQGQGMDIVSALALAQQLQPYGSESELLSLAKAIQADSSPSSTKLTESDKAYAQAREGFVDALAFLEQNGGSGKINTFTGNIKAFFGKTSANSQFQAKISNSTAALRKALIGTGQSEVELKNLNLPKATDEPAVARQKLIEAIKYIDQRPMGGNTGVEALSGILGY